MNIITKYWKLLTVMRLPYEVKPPYTHVVQIGDPVLHSPSLLVNRTEIETESIQKLIKVMRTIMVNDNLYGISATQVGVPLRIFALQFTEKHIQDKFSPEDIKKNDIVALPIQVWINPEVKIIDYCTNIQAEMCASLLSLQADVKRYNKILLSGFDQFGNIQSLEASDFVARIIQHEMDHLDGLFFTDKMIPRTLRNAFWKEINEVNGYLELNYFPKA